MSDIINHNDKADEDDFEYEYTYEYESEAKQLDVSGQAGKRRSAYAYDAAYIDAYLENPHKGKVAAYRIAIGGDHKCAANRAYDMHLRLRHEIEEKLRDRALGAASYGMSVLFDICEKTDNDNLRAACAGKLVDYGFKYSPAELIQQKVIKSRDELKAEINNTKARIKQLTNDDVA